MALKLLLSRLSTLLALVSLSTAISDALLPSYPLAVRSPYLSTWLPGHHARHVAAAQPEFWQGQPLSWPVLARVGGTVYSLFGVPQAFENVTPATTNVVNYTSTHTYVTLRAGPATFVLDFFSPVSPESKDYASQSLPYSYLTISATSDSLENIQILSGIDHTWTAQKGAAGLEYTATDGVGFFEFSNPDAIPFVEDDEMATWGSVTYAGLTGAGSSYTCGNLSNVVETFASAGNLTARLPCNGTDLAALAQDLGVVGITRKHATSAVGFERRQAINYVHGVRTGFYRTVWPTITQAVWYFLTSYPDALAYSLSLDNAIRSKAEAVSEVFGAQYADIVEASVRQTFGAMELTVPLDTVETDFLPRTDQVQQAVLQRSKKSTPWMFLKEISSNGNLNTVDVLFQSWPIFISLNPEYIRLFWEPVLEVTQRGEWPHPWVIHDLGTHYPNATGHPDGHAEQMPLYETSALFILLYAYEHYTNDTAYARQYRSLFAGYAEYLVRHGLYPATQLSSVDALIATPNQTALAVQSAIGLTAAGRLLGNDTLIQIGKRYASILYEHGLGLDGATPATSTHFTYNYGANNTWNVLFASFSDVVLGLDTFPAEAWALQSKWYERRMKAAGLPYGTPPASVAERTLERPDAVVDLKWGITDWNIMAAAVSSPALQAQVVNSTWHFMTNGLNAVPFGTKYLVEGPRAGVWVGNKARSTVGTHFALLAGEGWWWR